MDTFAGINSDPVTLHKYLYTPNDPINFVDYSGNTFLISSLSNTNITLLLRTSGTRILSFTGRGTLARKGLGKYLFGSPPKDFGLVGEVVVDYAINAVTAQFGVVYPNKGAFGTAAHLELEKRISQLEPYPGVNIEAEVFFLDQNDKRSKERKRNRAGRRERGSLGIDILVSYKEKPVIAFDLKTGRGFSKKKVKGLLRRTGVDIVEVRVDFNPK